MRTLLTCNKLDITWHQRVAGTEVIKIVFHSPLDLGRVLYVDESTYLPVEVADHLQWANGTWGRETYLFSWLPPTKASLALLNPTIPPASSRSPGKASHAHDAMPCVVQDSFGSSARTRVRARRGTGERGSKVTYLDGHHP
jgi:hypothetical protein